MVVPSSDSTFCCALKSGEFQERFVFGRFVLFFWSMKKVHEDGVV